MFPAFLLASLLQAAPPPEGAPEDKAAALASLDFVIGCMTTLSAYETAAAYAQAAAHLGSGLPPPAAPPWAIAVHVDSAQGRGCRVHYAGPRADAVWQADQTFLRGQPTVAADPANGCTFTEDSPTRLAGVCASTSDGQNGGPKLTRRADILIERAGEGSAATVTASVQDPHP